MNLATEKLNNENSSKKIEKLICIECEILTQSMECEMAVSKFYIFT